jgi:hypothetical protein
LRRLSERREGEDALRNGPKVALGERLVSRGYDLAPQRAKMRQVITRIGCGLGTIIKY